MRATGMTIEGEATLFSDEATDIAGLVMRHGFAYPDYLTPRQIEIANQYVVEFDKLASAVKAQKKYVLLVQCGYFKNRRRIM